MNSRLVEMGASQNSKMSRHKKSFAPEPASPCSAILYMTEIAQAPPRFKTKRATMATSTTVRPSSSNGGIDELLPLVLQLTNPDQVSKRKIMMRIEVIKDSFSACAIDTLLMFHAVISYSLIHTIQSLFHFMKREKWSCWN
jgi:hypothetical protein